MSSASPNIGFFARLKIRWYELLRAILHWWVRSNVLPKPFSDVAIDPELPVCFVIDNYALSDVLIMDRACEELELPRPIYPLELESGSESRSYLAMRRKKGLIIRRTTPRRHSESLKSLVDRVCDGTEEDVQLVPVTVLIGRAPDKETGLAKIFFTESWEIGGRFWRFLNSLINGRHTMVQFSDPISLRQLADEDIGEARTLRKVSRILRVHFQRVRTAAIGPDLSHRRTVVDQVLRTETVRKAIDEHARKQKTTEHKSWKTARGYAYEIAADYSYAFVRIASFGLRWFWNRIYDGVELRHFRDFQEQALGHEVIYVPCHRSHIDYLLVSYFLYHNGMVPPHIAAGLNMNLPVVGRFLRMGGAFYLRRSFRTQKLYSAVFHEYLSRIQSDGTAIEYFIEGTRSRTGRLLQPKAGMLSMSVRAFLAAPTRPIMFQPIYVGYEKLVEGNSYIAELSGAEKKKESLGDLFRALRLLKQRFGKVHVSFSEPVFLNDLLDRHAPDGQELTLDADQRPEWFTELIDELSVGIMTRINNAAHISCISLLSAILLTTRKQAIGRQDLISQLQLYLDLVGNCHYSERITCTTRTPEEMIEYGMDLGVLEQREHPLGEIIAVPENQSVLLTYFRNNISHLMAVPSLVASCFLNSRSVEPQLIHRIARAMHPFLKSELFLPWDEEAFLGAIDHQIEWLLNRGLLERNDETGALQRAQGGTQDELQLRIMAHGLLQTFERYYITVAILAKNGSGSMTRGELEKMCTLTAQRLSQLNEFAAPEFHDRNLFRHFISGLRDSGVITTNEEGKLEFGSLVESIDTDARYILSKEIRHGIIRIVPEVSAQE